MEQAVRKVNRGISPIWILPLVAFLIGAWLFYVSFRDAGIDVRIHFENAEGIAAGKTQVLYRGIPVGQVREITVDEDMQGVTLLVEMDKNTRAALVEDTKFWIVRPEVAAGKVRGLGTLLTGSYVAMQPGSGSEFSRNFEGIAESPPLAPNAPGLRITLTAEALYSLQKGSNVYTRDVRIGQVVDYYLVDSGKVVLDVHIEPEFSYLINTKTRFWNSSGVSLDGDIRRGFNLQLESLASMVYGGISCGAPSHGKAAEPVSDGHEFRLFRTYSEAESGVTVFLRLASGVGIVEGKTKVLYKGLQIGVVRKITIGEDDSRSVTAELQLDPRAEPVLKNGTKFWVIRPEVSLDGIRNIDTIISGSYITFEPGEGEYQDRFTVESGPHPNRSFTGGVVYVLETSDPSSLEVGSPVFYDRIKVGEVIDVAFGRDARSIRVETLIYEPHVHLVRKNTAFWNAGGFEAEVRMSGVKLDFSSLKTVLAGGIAFDNPKNGDRDKEKPVPSGTVFTLHKNFKEVVATVADFKQPGLHLQLRAGKIRGLRQGSPIFFNNLKVGEIIDFGMDLQHQAVLVDLVIQEPFMDLVNDTSRFYNLSGFSFQVGLDGLALQTDSFEAIAAGGIGFFTGNPEATRSKDTEFPLYETLEQAELIDKFHITIAFGGSPAIKENTKIKYKGVVVGTLKNIRFGKDFDEMFCDGLVDQEAAELFREGTRLRLVKPEFNLSGVENMSAILSGGYLELLPGEGEELPEHSLLSVVTDGIEIPGEGLHVVLETPRLGSLKKSSPVYFRQVPVGWVIGFELSPTTQDVWVHLLIEERYRNLIRSGTKFWLAGGIRLSGGLFSEFKLATESVEALVSGGIALATPEGDAMGKPVAGGDHFFLYPSVEEEWQNWRPVINLDQASVKHERK